MNKDSIWRALTPEQRQRLKEVLAKKGHVRDTDQPVEYKPTLGELRQAWKAKNNIK